MSPVGDQLSADRLGRRGRAIPRRRFPPWLLAVLFVGVVGGALLLTILIAKIVH